MIQIDMEMPKLCNNCPCSYFTEGMYNNHCQINGREFDKECEEKTIFGLGSGDYKRPKWCELKGE